MKDRELDALVAEKVMGYKSWFDTAWETHRGPLPEDRPVITPNIPHYSTDISAAWKVVEKIGCNTKGLFYHDAYVQWQCVLDPQRCVFDDCRISVFADTAPRAICLAALKAVGIEIDKLS